MGMGIAPTWLRQVSTLASHDHFNHWLYLSFWAYVMLCCVVILISYKWIGITAVIDPCLRVSEVQAKEQGQWRRLLTQTLGIISEHQTPITTHSVGLFSNGGIYQHMYQRPKSNWHFVGLGLHVTYFQLQFPLFVCFHTTSERELNWRSISLGNGRQSQRGTSRLSIQLIRMNYVPKHSREHASSEYYHMWGRL